MAVEGLEMKAVSLQQEGRRVNGVRSLRYARGGRRRRTAMRGDRRVNHLFKQSLFDVDGAGDFGAGCGMPGPPYRLQKSWRKQFRPV